MAKVAKPKIVRVKIPAGNYGRGRASKISQISEHHVVGDARHVIDKAKQPGRQFSTTFTVAMDGTIYQLVELGDTPYCDNAWQSNARSITIEHAGGANGFPYTAKMYASSIRLHAWLFQQYGNLRCVRHRDIPEIRADGSKATACPGGLNVEHIVNEARKLLKGQQEVKIGSQSNWRSRMNRLHHQLVGNWDMSDRVFKGIQGKEVWSVVESWSDHPNSGQLIKDQVLGEKARKDNWAGQITDLKAKLDAAKVEAMKYATNPTKEQYAALDQSLKTCEAQVQDLTSKMNEEAKPEGSVDVPKYNWFARFLAALFRRKKA